MADIFVSYRSDDLHVAQRIIERLKSAFGDSQVFSYFQDGELGLDYRMVIGRRLEECRLLLVIMGKHWLHAKNETETRKLDDEGDLVRLEIRSGLERGENFRVIPLLVEGTRMPREFDLPPDIAAFAKRTAETVNDKGFDENLNDLIKQLTNLGVGKQKRIARWLSASLATFASILTITMNATMMLHSASHLSAWSLLLTYAFSLFALVASFIMVEPLIWNGRKLRLL